MATCTLTFEDAPDGEVCVSIVFAPPVDEDDPTSAQAVGAAVLEKCIELLEDGRLREIERLRAMDWEE